MKCEICGKDFAHLGLHLNYRHKDITQKDYYDKYLKQGGEGFCFTCGNPMKFLGITKGYQHYCDAKCELKDPRISEKARNTYKERTGFDHNMHNPESVQRVKDTTIKNYGGIGFASKELADKVLDTFNNEHGTNITSCHMISHDVKEIEQQRVETRIKNNGGSYISEEHRNKIIKFSKDPEVIAKRISTRRKRYGDNYITDEAYQKLKLKPYKTYSNAKMIKFVKQGEGLCICHCDICGNDYEICQMTLRTRLYAKQMPCTICNPIGKYLFNATSNLEKELTNFIKNIYTGTIIENDRSVLNGKELDIYLPDKCLAFEFDGLFWHSEYTKENNYHLKKTEQCEKLGIQLIHIFEDEWRYKAEIVKSRIRGLIGLNNRIFARKCLIKEVPYKDSNNFLNENHIQGNCNSKYRYGLYYNDELVSLMTFGKSRFKDEFEMIRFCNKLNMNVIGGASKLFQHFIKNHPEIHNIISFADRRWSIGNLYKKIGFTKEYNTPVNYYYVMDYFRKNRIEFQKHKLVAEGFDPNLSEHEIMLSRGIYRIYDCGNIKFKYTV